MGMDSCTTALALPQADAFAVARLEEGSCCATPASPNPSCCSRACSAPSSCSEAARHRFELVVHDALQVELLEEMRGAHRFVLWIKIDTGMNRLGFPAAEFAAALARVRALTPRRCEIRLLTHLACADERDDRVTQEQARAFALAPPVWTTRSASPIPPESSAAVPLGCDWVRPGLALYGASPFADGAASELGLEPVMTLETAVIARAAGGARRAGRLRRRLERAAGFALSRLSPPATATACRAACPAARRCS